MRETCEQKARDLLERLSNCTYYHDPQQLSAGDVVELSQLFAEIERLHALCKAYRDYTVNQDCECWKLGDVLCDRCEMLKLAGGNDE